jgi:hypothetical protein
MKKLLSGLLIVLMGCQFGFAQQSASDLSQLDWLAGKWERLDAKPGQTAYENWNKEVAGYKGEGIKMRSTDTVFVDKLSIRLRNENLYYVAEVSHNADPTYFKITELSQDGFICENPGHDFPKKIEYRLQDEKTIRVTISGNGKSVPFIFERINR